MELDFGLLVMWCAAAGVGVIAWRKDRHLFKQGLHSSGKLIVFIATRLPLAIVLAGFLSQAIPHDWVAQAIGEDSGFGGLVIASFAGGLVPSGPFISFPIALTLYKSGASLPALVAFVTGWSVFAFHRVLIWEWPLMGAEFTLVRLVASLALPPLAGIAAGLLFAAF